MVAMQRLIEQLRGFPREATSTGGSTRKLPSLMSDKEWVSLGSESSRNPAFPNPEYFWKTNNPIGCPPSRLCPLDRKPTPGNSNQGPIRQERIRFSAQGLRFSFLRALNHRRTHIAILRPISPRIDFPNVQILQAYG